MNALSQDCRFVAQNEYMIDSSFLPVGRLLNDSADEIERLNVYRDYVRKSFVAMCGDDCVHEHHNLPRLIRELKAENEKLRALATFGTLVLREARDSLADLDGGFLQDTGVVAGVLREATVHEPCGEACACAEYGDFPHQCFQLVAGIDECMNELEGKP